MTLGNSGGFEGASKTLIFGVKTLGVCFVRGLGAEVDVTAVREEFAQT